MAQEYPDIKADYNHVDACCMWMVKNPEYYDVIVTTTMFRRHHHGLAAVLQGGLGVAAGGNINPDPGGVSMFEPMGGSAPNTRPERDQPHRRHQRHGDAAGARRADESGRAGVQSHPHGHRHENEKPGRWRWAMVRRKWEIWWCRPGVMAEGFMHENVEGTELSNHDLQSRISKQNGSEENSICISSFF